jgi:DNA excision repair protein ERCC-2
MFFPSYGTLKAAVDSWTSTGRMSRLEAQKRVCVEERDGAASMIARDNYYDAIESGRGAIFLAVCRGKVCVVVLFCCFFLCRLIY